MSDFHGLQALSDIWREHVAVEIARAIEAERESCAALADRMADECRIAAANMSAIRGTIMNLLDTISPTPERLRRDRFETPDVNQRTDRRAFRALTVPEQMGLSAELCDAYLDFVRAVEQASATKAGVGDYGERVNGGSDPQGSMAALADRRMAAGRELMRATHTVTDSKTAYVLIRLLAGDNPEAIGRGVLGKRNKTAAIAAAHERIEMACCSLAIGYGYIRPGVP